VDLDDRVVDIDQHWTTDQQWCLGCQPGQEPRGDRVQLPDVAEAECSQE
jgi:hypothetical protein